MVAKAEIRRGKGRARYLRDMQRRLFLKMARPVGHNGRWVSSKQDAWREWRLPRIGSIEPRSNDV